MPPDANTRSWLLLLPARRYNIAQALVGGTAPMVATELLNATGTVLAAGKIGFGCSRATQQ